MSRITRAKVIQFEYFDLFIDVLCTPIKYHTTKPSFEKFNKVSCAFWCRFGISEKFNFSCVRKCSGHEGNKRNMGCYRYTSFVQEVAVRRCDGSLTPSLIALSTSPVNGFQWSIVVFFYKPVLLRSYICF